MSTADVLVADVAAFTCSVRAVAIAAAVAVVVDVAGATSIRRVRSGIAGLRGCRRRRSCAEPSSSDERGIRCRSRRTGRGTFSPQPRAITTAYVLVAVFAVPVVTWRRANMPALVVAVLLVAVSVILGAEHRR